MSLLSDLILAPIHTWHGLENILDLHEGNKGEHSEEISKVFFTSIYENWETVKKEKLNVGYFGHSSVTFYSYNHFSH